ncbi:hypothetical protein V8E55_001707 [Tylopilus felleus]
MGRSMYPRACSSGIFTKQNSQWRGTTSGGPEQMRPKGIVTHRTDRCIWALRVPNLTVSQKEVAGRSKFCLANPRPIYLADTNKRFTAMTMDKYTMNMR